ncbi:MAG: DUF2341 domain-containing protein [Lentisphaerae bacterium]|nr:DUF2341 domain-containing protein [Lentisphaerota bacterium]
MFKTCRFCTLFLILFFVLTASAFSSEDFSAWSKRMPITFSGYPAEKETLINFPALIILEETDAGVGFSYDDFLSPPYGDLRFAGSDGVTPLDFEVESWNLNGKSFIWVKIPELTKDTKIYALWKKAGVGNPPCTSDGSVWSEDFAGVWHMNQIDALDSTANELHSDAYGFVSITDGMIGAAEEFDGNTAYLNVASSSLLEPDAVTFSMWIKATGVGSHSDNVILLSKGRDPGAASYGYWYNQITGLITARFGTAGTLSSQTVVPLDEWIYVVGTFGSDRRCYYRDGVLAASATTTKLIEYDIGDRDLHIGDWGYSIYTRRFKGVIDEVRISSVARSADWILACWENQGFNSDFVDYGFPEIQDLPYITNARGAGEVAHTDAYLNGLLISTGISETAVSVYWGDTDGGDNPDDWQNTNTWSAPQLPGDFSHYISGLLQDTYYYYRYMAENDAGSTWATETSAFLTSEVWFEKLSDASFLDSITGEVKVHRVRADAKPLDIYYSIGGTAVPGVDYLELPGIITIPPGHADATISIEPLPAYPMPKTKNVELKLIGCIKRNPSTIVTKIIGEDLHMWQKSMQITFPGYTSELALTNFPALVVFEESSLMSGFSYDDFLSPPYDDLRFVDGTGTTLAFEVESWDLNGKSYVWVKIPKLTHTTKIYAFWGKADVEAPASSTDGSVWSEDFIAVWHMNQTNAFDSTANQLHAESFGSVVVTDGIVGGADDFDGSTAYLNIPNNSLIEPPMITISAWIKATGPGSHSGDAMIFSKDRDSPVISSYSFSYNHSKSLISVSFKGVGSIPDETLVPLNEWIYVVATFKPGKMCYYRDGELVKSTAPSGPIIYYDTGDCDLHIGDWGYPNYARRFNGVLDEVRISSIARSRDWIWACWKNQGENESFNKYGEVALQAPQGTVYVFW